MPLASAPHMQPEKFGEDPMARRAAAGNVLKLTRSALRHLTLDTGQGERVWWDAEVVGLGYRLRGDRATWVIRPPRGGGKSSLITLGAAAVLDIADARKAARERLAQAALGQDPRTARDRRKAPSALTLGDALDRYVSDAEKRMRPSTFANLRTHQRVHFASLRGQPLVDVTRRVVADTIREVATTSGPQAALRARRTLSTFYGWCIGEGLAETNPVVGTNAPAHEIRRDRVLTRDELAAVWSACPASDDFGRIIRLLILTGQRRDEVAGLHWSEVDLDAGLWRLPAERTKNGRAHEVPLPPTAVEILAEAPQVGDRPFAFGSGSKPFSGFSKAKKRLDDRLKFIAPWRIHDLRRTAATGMAELGVLPHVIEAALNHISGHKAGVAGIYNRATYAPEKKNALLRWAEHVENL